MHPQQSYLIFATPRSGSYLLCEALTNTRLAGRPAEFFTPATEKIFLDHWGLTVNEYDQYLSKIFQIGATPNGVFGSKYIWLMHRWAEPKLRTIPGCADLELADLFSTLFPRLQYISITRRDKIRQAISYAKAIQTSQWVRVKGEPAVNEDKLVFDPTLIDRERQEIEREEQEMQAFFAHHGIQPFTVVYEELVTTYEETAKNILRYLNIPFTEPLVFGERSIVRQADDLTEEWFQRYTAYLREKDAVEQL